MHAHPSAKPMLVAMEFVGQRHVRGPGRLHAAWFLTRAGREVLAKVGANEVQTD